MQGCQLFTLSFFRGANIEEVNDEGYTPLMEAAREGHEEMVALLLSQGTILLQFLLFLLLLYFLLFLLFYSLFTFYTFCTYFYLFLRNRC